MNRETKEQKAERFIRNRNVHEFENSVVYQVEGDHDNYFVILTYFDKEQISFRWCSCPHDPLNEGGSCSHMIAAEAKERYGVSKLGHKGAKS